MSRWGVSRFSIFLWRKVLLCIEYQWSTSTRPYIVLPCHQSIRSILRLPLSVVLTRSVSRQCVLGVLSVSRWRSRRSNSVELGSLLLFARRNRHNRRKHCHRSPTQPNGPDLASDLTNDNRLTPALHSASLGTSVSRFVACSETTPSALACRPPYHDVRLGIASALAWLPPWHDVRLEMPSTSARHPPRYTVRRGTHHPLPSAGG